LIQLLAQELSGSKPFRDPRTQGACGPVLLNLGSNGRKHHWDCESTARSACGRFVQHEARLERPRVVEPAVRTTRASQSKDKARTRRALSERPETLYARKGAKFYCSSVASDLIFFAHPRDRRWEPTRYPAPGGAAGFSRLSDRAHAGDAGRFRDGLYRESDAAFRQPQFRERWPSAAISGFGRTNPAISSSTSSRSCARSGSIS